MNSCCKPRVTVRICFEDDIYANSTGPYTDYDIPGEP